VNQPDPRRWRRFASNALLATSAVLATLLVLEAAFRLGAFMVAGRRFEEALQEAPEIQPGQEVGLGQIIRRSPNRKTVYELAPSLSVTFHGAPLNTNRRGFRDRERSTEKPAGTLRIVGIGDSVMFGWGVGDDASYLAQLEGLLDDDPSGRRWEVINTAVPGYNGVMEVEALKEKGLALQPDIVILGFCGNDLKLPGFIWTDDDYLSLSESFLLRFLRQRLGDVPEGDFDIGLEPPQGRKGDSRLVWAGKDLPNVPARYADLVGKQNYRRAMQELAELARTHRFDVLVVSVPGIPRRAHELFEGLDFDLVRTRRVINEFIRDHAIEDWRGSSLSVAPDDPHPSKLANSLVAQTLYDHIVDNSLPRSAQAPESP